MQFTGTLTNNQTLMRANDGSGFAVWLTGNITSGYVRIGRTWQFQEKNGNLGNMIISSLT